MAKYGACLHAAAFRDGISDSFTLDAQPMSGGRWLVQSLQLAFSGKRWFEAIFDETTLQWLVTEAPRGC